MSDDDLDTLWNMIAPQNQNEHLPEETIIHADSTLRDRVFNNDLVWTTLASRLRVSELKVVRLVCVNFNKKILTATNFRNRVQVQLNSCRLLQTVFGTTQILFKHFKIDLTPYTITYNGGEREEDLEWNLDKDPAYLDTWFYPMLQLAETIVIHGHRGTDYDDYGDGLSRIRYPKLVRFLEAPKEGCLKSLAVDANWLEREEQLFAQLSDKGKFNLENLQQLFILSPGLPLASYKEQDRYRSCFEKNMNFLVSMVNQKLSHFEVAQGVEIEQPPSFGDLKIQTVLKLVEVNKDTLTTLNLFNTNLWSLTPNDGSLLPVSQHYFPRLKTLGIRIQARNIPADALVAQNDHEIFPFLNQHLEELEELKLTMLPTIPDKIWYLIGQRGKFLKELYIKTKALSGCHHDNYQDGNNNVWRSLFSNLDSLESVRMHVPRSNRTAKNFPGIGDLIACLPATIKSIGVEGVGPPNHRGGPYGGYGDVANQLSVSHLELLGTKVGVNLTQLSLRRCGDDSVGDAGLQLIFKNFNRLQLFEISDNPVCTDFGFTGIRETPGWTNFFDDPDPRLEIAAAAGFSVDEPTFSIKDLKGLRYLMIQECGKITGETYDAIEFLELRALILCGDHCGQAQMNKFNLKNILKNNPSLELVKTTMDDWDFLEMAKGHPRFKKHFVANWRRRYDLDDSAPEADGYYDDDPTSVRDIDSDYGDSD